MSTDKHYNKVWSDLLKFITMRHMKAFTISFDTSIITWAFHVVGFREQMGCATDVVII